VPILVKVVIKDPNDAGSYSDRYNFEYEKVDPVTWNGPDSDYKTGDVRGIVGLQLVRPDDASDVLNASGEETYGSGDTEPLPL
jgi:hypothetical protein